jgi:hypothetical protein
MQQCHFFSSLLKWLKLLLFIQWWWHQNNRDCSEKRLRLLPLKVKYPVKKLLRDCHPTSQLKWYILQKITRLSALLDS